METLIVRRVETCIHRISLTHKYFGHILQNRNWIKLKELTFHRMIVKSHMKVQNIATKLLNRGKNRKNST